MAERKRIVWRSGHWKNQKKKIRILWELAKVESVISQREGDPSSSKASKCLSQQQPSIMLLEAQNQGSAGVAHGLDFEKKHDRLCFAGINIFRIPLERRRRRENE